uniref:Uncharacterized protein n=1 Tax=Anopheles maculatus TaxID=74869 RepID=A0A182SF06_9DIPT
MIPNNQEQNQEQRANNNAEEGGATFDKEWFTNFQQFCVLMAAANRLRVQDLVDAAVRFLVGWREGKDMDEIREMMENLGSNVREPNQAGDALCNEFQHAHYTLK